MQADYRNAWRWGKFTTPVLVGAFLCWWINQPNPSFSQGHVEKGAGKPVAVTPVVENNHDADLDNIDMGADPTLQLNFNFDRTDNVSVPPSPLDPTASVGPLDLTASVGIPPAK